MVMHNPEIAEIFDTLADLLEIEDANPFRIRAYRNAARTIRGLPRSLADMVEEGEDLSELQDIGQAISGKIRTIVETGRLPQLEEAAKRTPRELADLMKIEGLGPKRVKALHDALNIQNLEDLERAAAQGKVRALPGFGRKTEESIRRRIKDVAMSGKRWKRLDAESIAEPLLAYLKQSTGINKIAIAGSYRRRRETVGDLDILVAAAKGSPVMQRFVKYDEVSEVISQGDTRSTVRLRSGLHVDLRVVPEVSYGAALHYFTGSKAHNIAVRKRGVKREFKINEYGVFRGDERIAGETEEEIFRQVGLPYIEPELREDRGEIEAAENGELPRLIRLEEIRGDLHCHTRATDGHNTLEEMAKAAAELGYEYLVITDHSRRLTIAHGLDEKRLRQQIEEIDHLNEKLHGIVLLKSIEVDIMEDGTLDLPNHILKHLDMRVCSVHYKFGLSREKQTRRVLRAMDNPYFDIFGHPSGRLIDERDPYAIDLEEIMEAAKERNCLMEINAQPQRLDLTDEACKMAKGIGVKVVISTDAHSVAQLRNMRLGVDQARRGWLEADDVANTRPLADLQKLLRR